MPTALRPGRRLPRILRTMKLLTYALQGALTLGLLGPLAITPTAARAQAAVGQPAPALELPTAGGAVISLSQLRGKVVYLDFWASWCAPCRQSFPWMGDLHRRLADRGLVVLAVNLDTKSADAQAFLKAVPAPFTVAFDPAGQSPRQYGIKAMPTSVLIGRDGRVKAIHGGFRPSDTAALESTILQALQENP